MKMLAFWVTILVTLGGCASIDTFEVMLSCQAIEREQKALLKSCLESDAIGTTQEMCDAIIIPECEDEVVAWNRHEEAVLRREAKLKLKSFCAERGLVRYCESRGIPRPEDCRCVRKRSVEDIFRRW